MSFDKEIAVSVSNVSKYYATQDSNFKKVARLILNKKSSQTSHLFKALDGISFNVNKGESFAIIGKNGAGKSTLLQIICSTLVPTSGTVKVNGRLAALLELGSGFNPEFSGLENVYLNAAIYGLSRKEVDNKLSSILAFADIGEFIYQPVKTYSSGMFVRLAFAVIAHIDADILIIDEALAVGDIYFTQKCMRFLDAFAEKGTLVFVSHDTSSVVRLCKNALWIEQGKVKQLGDANEVVSAYLASFYETDESKLASVKPDVKIKKENSLAQVKNNFSSAFGLGGGKITQCVLLDAKGALLSLVDKAQPVQVSIDFEALEVIESPIIGFFVKDRLGQPLFGDNTLNHVKDFSILKPGQTYCAQFEFMLPQLAIGDYTISVALAAGTQTEHVQHHWVHDIYSFKSKADPSLTGFFKLNDLKVVVK